MVSHILLAKLHRRLQEIKKNREAFGGVFLVVFGDLLQLPPVRISPPFCAINPRLVHQIFHCIPTELKLWDKFEYRELTENMRQKEDKDYSDVLNRIRIGSPIDEDYEKLLNRCISVLKEGDQWTKDKPIPRPIYLAEAVEYFNGSPPPAR